MESLLFPSRLTRPLSIRPEISGVDRPFVPGFSHFHIPLLRDRWSLWTIASSLASTVHSLVFSLSSSFSHTEVHAMRVPLVRGIIERRVGDMRGGEKTSENFLSDGGPIRLFPRPWKPFCFLVTCVLPVAGAGSASINPERFLSALVSQQGHSEVHEDFHVTQGSFQQRGHENGTSETNKNIHIQVLRNCLSQAHDPQC